MASLPTLDEIKAALGIDPADTTKDAAIERTLEAVIDIIETYCGRGFAYKDVVEEFDPITSRDRWFLLFRFPVKSLTKVSDGTSDFAASSFQLFKAKGLLRVTPGWMCCASDRAVIVEYAGGYEDDDWPAGLVDVINGFFYAKWSAQGAGNVANASTAGAVKSASVDGLTVTYADALGASSSALNEAVIPAGLEPWAAQLEPYRARRAMGA